jgi:nucleoside-diphosphate-sugar epimerase
VFASTATVYGVTERFAVGEEFEPRPITVYDLHKLFAEQQLALASRDGLIENVSLRLANVYGPSSSVSSAADRGVLNRITELALHGNDLSIYGDGSQLRDYVYIDDVVDAFLLAGLSDEIVEGPMNVATGRSISLKEAFALVAEGARKATGQNVRIRHAPWPANASAIEYRSYVADITRIARSFGWTPQVSLEAGIDHMIRTHLENGGTSVNRFAPGQHGPAGRT